jgi:hypothetical protein
MCIAASIFVGQAGNRDLHEIEGVASANTLVEECQFAQPGVFCREFEKCDDIPRVGI